MREPLRVLIADDETIAREGMRDHIPWAELGMAVPACVENGALALDYLQNHPVDIFIMDIRMPVMDGLEVLEQVGRLGINVLIIVVSAYDQFEYAQKAIKSRLVFEYVLKPLKRSSFRELLRRAAASVAQTRREAPPPRRTDSQEEVYRQFSGLLEQGELDRALEVLSQYAGQVDPADGEALFQFKRLLLNLHSELYLAISRDGKLPPPCRQDFDLLGSLNQRETPEELCQYFRALAEEVRPLLAGGEGERRSKSSAVIDHCVEEIERQYTDPKFSLYQLAERMCLSTSYLSSRFKKELGVGFVRYLNTLRVERAKQLLRDMSYRTNEIADLVGIENPRYFARVFKAQTGLTPSEYRSRIKFHASEEADEAGS